MMMVALMMQNPMIDPNTLMLRCHLLIDHTRQRELPRYYQTDNYQVHSNMALVAIQESSPMYITRDACYVGTVYLILKMRAEVHTQQ
jgi:hypothetical protein